MAAKKTLVDHCKWITSESLQPLQNNYKNTTSKGTNWTIKNTIKPPKQRGKPQETAL